MISISEYEISISDNAISETIKIKKNSVRQMIYNVHRKEITVCSISSRITEVVWVDLNQKDSSG